MNEINGTFAIEQENATVIVAPLMNLGELEYDRIERGGREILERLAAAHAKNVVLDLGQIDYFGSTALGFFVRLWNRASQQGGQMALCGVSRQEREVLQRTRLDTVWSICDTRDEALAAISTT